MTGTVLKTLDARITSDHYDLSAILERLLLSAALGDFAAARSDAKVFERLGFSARALSVLSKVADGDALVAVVGQVYVIDAPTSVNTEALGATLNAARIELAALTNKPPKVTWVDFHDGPAYANITRLELPGVARISLSRQFQVRSDWPAILWHEAAHATMFASVRFLDEGWAVWCQAKSGVKSEFPVRDTDLETCSLAPEVEAMPLARLLAYSGPDLIFGDLATSDLEWRSIYVRAYRFFKAIHGKLGMGGVVTIFEALSRDRQDVPGILRRLCNASSEEIERSHHWTAMSTNAETALRSIELSRRTLSADTKPNAVSVGRNANLEKALNPSVIDERTLRRRGQELAGIAIEDAQQMRKPQETVVAELDSTITALVENGWIAGAELLKARKSTVALLLSSNWVEKSKHSNAAKAHFERAEAISPNDAEISVAFAKFELNKPGSLRNLDHAIEHLNRAMLDISWRAEAETLARTFGVFERLAETEEPGASIVPATVSGGSPCVLVEGIRLDTKEQFVLDIKRLEIPPASRVAVVGANGAGKTTLMDAIVGLRSTEVADVFVFGDAIKDWRSRPELRTQFGYQTQRPSFPPLMSVAEILRLRKACYGEARPSADRLEVLSLSKLQYGSLSTGQRRRLDLYVALGHEPRLAFLDEPTSGLDSYFQQVVRKLLLDSGARTMIFASNERRELECATHILWLRAGRLVKFGAAETILLETVGRYRAHVELRDNVSAKRWLDAALEKLPTLRRYQTTSDGAVQLFADTALDLPLRDNLGEVESYTFARASYADLIDAIAHEASRA